MNKYEHLHSEIPAETEDNAYQQEGQSLLDRMREKFAAILRFFKQYGLSTVKRRMGQSARTVGRRRKASQVGRVRLGRPRGPGTIHAKADGLYLARTGKFKEAAEMLAQQFPELASRYRRFADNPTESPFNSDYDPARFYP